MDAGECVGGWWSGDCTRADPPCTHARTLPHRHTPHTPTPTEVEFRELYSQLGGLLWTELCKDDTQGVNTHKGIVANQSLHTSGVGVRYGQRLGVTPMGLFPVVVPQLFARILCVA